MSLSIITKKRIESEKEISLEEDFPDISRLIIPFEVVFENLSPPDIYNGEELIPFEEKDLEFREILIHEFIT